MAASVWGYIGCFKIVQSSTSDTGPLVWLILELFLSVLRLWIWAFNPATDDPPPPIVILSGDLKPDAPRQDYVAHDIGWRLEDVTVDMHALVIDIHSGARGSGPRWPMFEYLTQHLAVPEDQVQHVRGSNPQEIRDALRSLAKNIAIPRGSPIVIYISHHSNRPTDSEWIGNVEQGLSYATFFELVRRISGTKGENVAVILDTNFPVLGTEAEHESEPYVLLTACSSGEIPHSGNVGDSGGSFTLELLAALGPATVEKLCYEELSYEEVVRRVAEHLKVKGQTPKCMGIFKKRRIFNGILARKRLRKAKESDSTSSLISATFARPTGDEQNSRSSTHTTLHVNGNANGTLRTANGH
ncbi:hypothetical protein B0H13DRAFT_1968531 [Mycena leptocephala]|nr:hypothetical protein B0H13DRAFT_1968531 [Mycena leptocephala]